MERENQNKKAEKETESLEARAAATKTEEVSNDEADKIKNEKLPYNPNVTKHDLDVLGQENVHGDGGDDQQLKDRVEPVDFAGEDLDVPGRNQARKWDERGLPDEENKLYSQGGEDKENLEEDNSAL